jgi:hypothetical protein
MALNFWSLRTCSKQNSPGAKPGGARSLQHECDTTQPRSAKRGQRQNRPMCVREGQSQENQFQTEIGRMPDEAIESASLPSLPGARLKTLPRVAIATTRTPKPRIKTPKSTGRSQLKPPMGVRYGSQAYFAITGYWQIGTNASGPNNQSSSTLGGAERESIHRQLLLRSECAHRIDGCCASGRYDRCYRGGYQKQQYTAAHREGVHDRRLIKQTAHPAQCD